MEDPLTLLNESIWEIVERSAFLEERLTGEFLAQTSAEDSAHVEKRMAAWQKNCARDDEKVFAKRLQRDGLDPDRARRLVGRVRRVSAELPAWAQVIRRVIAWSGKPGDEMLRNQDLASIRGEEPVAFEEFAYPFLQLARSTLRQESGDGYALLAEVAHRQWERSLLLSCEEITAEALDLEFTHFRAAHLSPQAPGGLGSGNGIGSRKVYEAFLHSLEGEGLLRFFLGYPVLARHLATRLTLWVDAAREFLLRLTADGAELEARFNQGQPLGLVIKLDTDLSDPHRAGRTALRARFASGISLIYKPKPMAVETAYWNLLDWINRTAELPAFRTIKVLDGGAYGWVEEIAPAPCQDPREVQSFYHRAGMLLCLVYALEGTDCHRENLIAAGEHPMLIDHETLFQPRIRQFGPAGEEGPLALARRFFYEESVLRTGLLPRREIRPSGESFDVSGLGGTERHLTHFKKTVWENINTDAMRLGTAPAFTRLTDNVVMLDGKVVQAAPYVDQIAAGFEHMYRFLQAHGHGMVEAHGPLRHWSGLRFVFRETWIYGSIQRRLYSPRCLRDGMDSSIELELLSRPLLHDEARPFHWPLLAEERRSLLQGDIPMFQYAAEDDALRFEGGESIPQFFRESGFSQSRRRLESLSDEDRERQLTFLRASFDLQEGEPEVVGDPATGSSEVPERTLIGRDDFLAEALSIARQISCAANRFQDGVSWNTLAYYPEAQRWQFQPMSPCFYDGICGVALFLAAVQKCGGEPESAALARSALTTVVGEALRPAYARVLFASGIGAGVGQSSIIYALVRAGEFLGEEEWLHHAESFAAMLDAGRIASDRQFDLMSGAAGAILALLALYRANRLPANLEKAVLCGEHLLQHRSASAPGPRAWKTLWDKMLTGFSHGTAGIAYALLKLHEATGENSFREAAIEAEAYETSVFMPAVSNWPDLRDSPGEQSHSCMTAWCHGAAGIAMSRLATLPLLDTPQVREDIFHGLKAIQMAGTQRKDTACCGRMGRVETLLVAAKALNDPAYRQGAQELASSTLQRARQQGSYTLGWKRAPYLASFHQGMAGVGYEYLRLAAPAPLPSLLLWE